MKRICERNDPNQGLVSLFKNASKDYIDILDIKLTGTHGNKTIGEVCDDVYGNSDKIDKLNYDFNVLEDRIDRQIKLMANTIERLSQENTSLKLEISILQEKLRLSSN